MRSLFSGIVALAVFAPTVAVAGPPSWSFSESSGQVIVMSPGVSRIARRNDALKVGDTVATGPNGRAIVVRGQEYLVVAPNSRFRIADPAQSGGLTQIVEQSGNIVFRIKKMATPHFGVQTPYLAAVVKGTTFSVTVNERGATVQVIEGRVEVATRDGGAAYMVMPGDIGAVSATARQTLDVKGRETRSIVSPLPPEALPPAGEDKTEATPALWSDTPATAMDGTIVASIGEGPVRLDTLSDGLVRGDSSLGAVIATTTVASRTAAPVPVVPAIVPAGNAASGAPALTVETAPAPAVVAPMVVAAADTATAAMTPEIVTPAIIIPAAAVTAAVVVAAPAAVTPIVELPAPVVTAPVVAVTAPVGTAPAATITAPVITLPAVTEPAVAVIAPIVAAPVVAAPVVAAPVVTAPVVTVSTPAPAAPIVSVVTPIVTVTVTAPTVTGAVTGGLTSCAGVPNCNGSTYTGPSNVQNGSSCAGVANCNGGAFNVTGNAGSNNSGSNSGSNGNNGNGNNGNGNGNGGNNGNHGNGNNGNHGNGNNGNGNGDGDEGGRGRRGK